MNQKLVGTLHVSFCFHPSIHFSRTSKLGITRKDILSVNSFRKNSTIATNLSQRFSVKRIAGLEHSRFVIDSTNYNKFCIENSVFPTSLSYGLSLSVGLAAASHYLGKFVYCSTEKFFTETVESTPEETLPSSQSSSSTDQTTKENVTSSSPSSSPSSPDEQPFSLSDLFNIQQITFGTSMGFASGYFVKKVSKTVAALVGAIFVLLQVLEHQGYITIYWNKFEENYNKILDLDKDGKVTANDCKLIFYKVVNFLSRNFQTDAGFVIGFGVGLRYG